MKDFFFIWSSLQWGWYTVWCETIRGERNAHFQHQRENVGDGFWHKSSAKIWKSTPTLPRLYLSSVTMWWSHYLRYWDVHSLGKENSRTFIEESKGFLEINSSLLIAFKCIFTKITCIVSICTCVFSIIKYRSNPRRSHLFSCQSMFSQCPYAACRYLLCSGQHIIV